MKKLAALVAGVTLLLLTGCTPIVALEPAEDAVNAQCAEVMVRLPDTVPGRDGDLAQRETNAQGTSAWGEPTTAIIRCGVPVPDPTSTLPCYSAGSIDWLLDESDTPNLVYTSYGRDPAVEVIVDQDNAAGGVILLELENAMSFTTKVSECTDVEDSI